MLCEIFCEKFKQHKITFHKGLNVVLGTSKADNSIGKSTLLSIIDYAFGGTLYSKSQDIKKNIGNHFIFFKFIFNDDYYVFGRSILEPNLIWKSDLKYNKISTITLNEYHEWLSNQYKICLYKLSFRDAVGRYIRVYGKDNYDEKRPLNAVHAEPGNKACIALLKLFDLYSQVDNLENEVNTLQENLKTFKKAQSLNYIASITKQQYVANIQRISDLNAELYQISNEVDKGLLNIDALRTERGLEIKNEIIHAKRLRTRLKNKILNLNQNYEYNFSSTTNDFSNLLRFFPGVSIAHLSEIENFHRNIVKIFHSEIRALKSGLEDQILKFDHDIAELEKQLDETLCEKNISSLVLQKCARVISDRERFQKENESFEKFEKLRETNESYKKQFENAKKEQFSKIEEQLNTQMSIINGYLYFDNRTPPKIHFEKSNYVFLTPDDTGTGVAYKGLIVFDLAVLHLTKLPVLVHDSPILKQISNDVIEGILQLYSESQKQIFIALDKQNSYSSTACKILEDNAVIHLMPNGGELFGWSWGKSHND